MMIFVVIIVYWWNLSILVNEAFQREAVSHIILIPFLISYLIYRKKELVKASFAFENFQGKAKLISLGDIVGAAFCLWHSFSTGRAHQERHHKRTRQTHAYLEALIWQYASLHI